MQKDELEFMACFYPEADFYEWLVQFTWQCNIFTCTSKGLKFLFDM